MADLNAPLSLDVPESMVDTSGTRRRRQVVQVRMSQLVRAIKATQKIGLRVAKAEISPSGQFILTFGQRDAETKELDLVALARSADRNVDG